jgi:hypothetical protein
MATLTDFLLDGEFPEPLACKVMLSSPFFMHYYILELSRQDTVSSAGELTS